MVLVAGWIRKMEEAAAFLIGTHDLRVLRQQPDEKSTVRRIDSLNLKWQKERAACISAIQEWLLATRRMVPVLWTNAAHQAGLGRGLGRWRLGLFWKPWTARQQGLRLRLRAFLEKVETVWWGKWAEFSGKTFCKRIWKIRKKMRCGLPTGWHFSEYPWWNLLQSLLGAKLLSRASGKQRFCYGRIHLTCPMQPPPSSALSAWRWQVSRPMQSTPLTRKNWIYFCFYRGISGHPGGLFSV